MLRLWQAGVLAVFGAALWVGVTIAIHAFPQAALDRTVQVWVFAAAPVAGLISVWACRGIGRLTDDQIVSGVVATGAVAMMMDGAALLWLPRLYGGQDAGLRIVGAALMWSYGTAFAAALAWQAWVRRPIRRSAIGS